MAAVTTISSDFGAPPKITSLTVSIFSPSIWHEVMGLADFPDGSDSKASVYNVGDLGLDAVIFVF